MKNLVDFDVLSPKFQANPYPTYAKMHQKNEMLIDRRLNAYFIGHYEGVRQVLHSPEFTTAPLAKRAEPVMGDRVLAQMEGAEHHGKRRAVLSGLTGRLFREHYAALIPQTTERLLGQYLSVGQIDLISQFGREYSVLVTLQVLGLPIDRHREVAIWHSGVAAFITSLSMSDEQKKFSLECSRRLIEYLTPIVEERMKQPDEGLISTLCGMTTEGQKMTTSEIVALVLNILLAATEPADKTLAYLFKHLLDNPEQFKRVVLDRSLLGVAIDESLRLTSPVQLIPRQVDADVNINGIEIPKGSLVFCMIGAANRDPSVFDHPDEFRIDRKQSADRPSLGKTAHHLAFGAGMHVCVGAAFSLKQIELTASLILDRLPNLQLAPGYKFLEEGLYTRGPASLQLRFDPAPNGITNPADLVGSKS